MKLKFPAAYKFRSTTKISIYNYMKTGWVGSNWIGVTFEDGKGFGERDWVPSGWEADNKRDIKARGLVGMNRACLV